MRENPAAGGARRQYSRGSSTGLSTAAEHAAMRAEGRSPHVYPQLWTNRSAKENPCTTRDFAPGRGPVMLAAGLDTGRTRASVEHQVELSAENLWEEISGRLREAL